MNKSRHAEKRCQKRGIKNKTINLLFEEGIFVHQKGGTKIVVFPKKIKPIIEKNNLKIKNIKNAFMVTDKTASDTITTEHDYKNVHKKSHRKFHRKSNTKLH